MRRLLLRPLKSVLFLRNEFEVDLRKECAI